MIASRPCTVIIPSKSASNLRYSLQALLAQTGPCVRVIVVDDGVESPRPFDVFVQYVPGVKPFCFARNVNIGAKHCAGENLIIMNDDAMLQPGNGINRMLFAMEQHPGFPVVSAAIQGAACNHRLIVQRHQYTKPKPGIHDAGVMVPFIFTAIDRVAFDEIGGLDERFTDYGFEDDDFCRAVRSRGGRIGVHYETIVEHGTLPSAYRSIGPCPLEPNYERFISKWGNHEGIGEA